PKPHTPLQWAGFDDIAQTRDKMATLKSSLTRRNIRPKWENPECAFVQALLARGDERLGAVIERVYKQGGIFQEWTEFFNFSLWQKACAEAGVDPQEFLGPRSVEERLPWEFIDVGVSREFLRTEFARAQAGVTTPDCYQAGCTGCGVCPDKMPPAKPARPEIEERQDLAAAYGRRPRPIRSYEEPRTRFRLKYAVDEPFRFAAHLDRVRAFYRALRRSELPVAWTKGFAPKPVLSFGPPLPVGLLSDGEYLDLFTQFHYSGNIVRDFGPFLPRGLRIVAARPVPPEYPSLGQLINLGIYEIELPEALVGRQAAIQERARNIPGVRELRPTGEQRFLLGLAIVPGVKLFDRLARLLDIPEAVARTIFVRRRDCLVADDSRIRTPLGEDVNEDDLRYQPPGFTEAGRQAE
ncbi:MAG: TIGR03936 family radical SAM-associated protein, partial [candidate division WOR-3 bacterium]